MVLTRSFMLKALAYAAALGASSCVPKVPPQRLATATPIAVAFVVDEGHYGQPQPVPEALKRQVFEALASRNLEAVEVPATELNGQRLTAERLSALKAKAKANKLSLLVELRATFFNQIAGRYRWSVATKLSVINAQGATATDGFDLPASLQFEHQREDDAMADVAGSIAKRVGPLLDGVLVTEPKAVAPAAKAESIYFVMIDRFANGEPGNDAGADVNDPQGFHGGDLAGLIERLDWLQSLHVRTVWLSPVFRLRAQKVGQWGGYHGYWVERLDEVEPRFGTPQQLAQLSAELHRRGMELVLDLVLNHAAPDGELWRQKPKWFHHLGDITDWSNAQQVVSNDVHGLPDLDESNPEVYSYLSNAAHHWLSFAHVDGYRLDAVKHLPVSFWARFNREMATAGGPRFWLLGEHLDGDPASVSATWREGGFNAMFDFPLRYAMVDVFCKDATPARLAAVLTEDRRYTDPSRLVTLLDNHDLPRVMSECHGDAHKAADALHFMLTTRGVPSLIWGTETGLSGEREPFNRPSMVFDDRHPLKAAVSRLLAARADSPALAAGAVAVAAADRHAVAILRVSPDQAALTVLNRGQHPVTVPVPAELKGAAWHMLGENTPASLTIAPGPQQVLTTPVEPGRYAALAQRVDHQWRTGSLKRPVEIAVKGRHPTGKLVVVGSGPELGGWNVGQGVPLPTRAELPVGGVFELKVVSVSESGAPSWEPGDNRVLFVESGTGPIKLEVEWGKT